MRAVRRDTLRLRASEQWSRKLRGELVSQAAFLDALVESLGAVSSLHASRVLERTADQAQALFDCDAVIILTLDADGMRLRPAVARGVALGPMSDLAVHLDASESLVAEAARSHVLAAGPGDGAERCAQPSPAPHLDRRRPTRRDGRAPVGARARPHRRG